MAIDHESGEADYPRVYVGSFAAEPVNTGLLPHVFWVLSLRQGTSNAAR